MRFGRKALICRVDGDGISAGSPVPCRPTDANGMRNGVFLISFGCGSR